MTRAVRGALRARAGARDGAAIRTYNCSIHSYRENEARHSPHPCRCFVSQAAAAMEPGHQHPAAHGGWPLSVALDTRCQFHFRMPCAASQVIYMADAEAKQTRASDPHAGRAQRASVVMVQADQACETTRSERSDNAAAVGRVLTLRAASVRPVTARQACMAQDARRAVKHGPGRAINANEGPREDSMRAREA